MDTQLAIRIQTKGTRPRFTRIIRDMLQLHNDHIIRGDSLWGTCKECLLSTRTTDTHILVLQDDVLPCADFIRTVHQIIALLPNEAITLFTTSELQTMALQHNIRWVQLTAWFMAQAYILPVSLAHDMVVWIDKNCKESMVHDDDRMATYMWYHNRKVWATAPSLVEHIGWNYTTLDTYKKTYRFEPRLRMANQYIGFEKSGLSVDWTLGLTTPLIDKSGSNSMFCSNLKRPL